MSAWMVDDEHVHVLLHEGMRPTGDHSGPLTWAVRDDTASFGWRQSSLARDNADRVGQMLIDQNAASVDFRYDEDSNGREYTYHRPNHTDWEPAEVFKAINCYEYQACETNDWSDTEAHAFCRALEARLIRRLPGYERADTWGITERTKPLKVVV